MQDLPMKGSVALVAGASKGIGAATAEAFAAAGAAVVLAARDVAALKSVVQRIESAGGDAIGVGCDVSDVDSVPNLIHQAIARYGPPDAAFNNPTDGPLPPPPAQIHLAAFDP